MLAWIDAQMIEALYLSAISVAELRFGLAAMPAGKRHAIYQDRVEGEVLPVFTGRVLPFALNASQAYADQMAKSRAADKAIGKADSYIAATAAARGLMAATRDTSPFEAADLNIINPWEAEE